MGDDDVRNVLRQFLDRGFFVLVHVDDQMRRRQLADLAHVHILGPAHFRHRLDLAFRMNAEAGAADDPVAEPEFEKQLGNAGNEADDPGIRPGGRMDAPDRVGQRWKSRVHAITPASFRCG